MDAVDLTVLQATYSQPRTARSLCKKIAAGLKWRALAVRMDALAAAGYLERQRTSYRILPAGTAYLARHGISTGHRPPVGPCLYVPPTWAIARPGAADFTNVPSLGFRGKPC